MDSNLIDNNRYTNIFSPFILITFINIILAFAVQNMLVHDELYYNSLVDRFTFEQIQSVVKQTHRWLWLSYILAPILNVLKFVCIASCLSLGYWFISNKWHFKTFLRIVIFAELVFIAAIVIKLVWFLFFHVGYSLQDLQYFYPLSVLNFFDYNTLDVWSIYPLQLLNAFEVIYWVILAYGMKQLLNIKMANAIKLVAVSYGSALLLCVVFLMFLAVNM